MFEDFFKETIFLEEIYEISVHSSGGKRCINMILGKSGQSGQASETMLWQGLLTIQSVFQSEVRSWSETWDASSNCSFSHIAPEYQNFGEQNPGSCILNGLPRFSCIVKLENCHLPSLPLPVSSLSISSCCPLPGHSPWGCIPELRLFDL